MQRRTEIIIGAAATALTAASPMLATPATAQPISAAVSYADLLEPVPNAMERLTAADDAARGNAHLIAAQYRSMVRSGMIIITIITTRAAGFAPMAMSGTAARGCDGRFTITIMTPTIELERRDCMSRRSCLLGDPCVGCRLFALLN